MVVDCDPNRNQQSFISSKLADFLVILICFGGIDVLRKIVVSEFMTLDGVMEDPGGSEGTQRGGWAFRFNRGQEGDKFKFDELLDTDALLLGRTTYQAFANA